MNPARIAVLDYGSGNVHSAVRALARTGAQAELSADFQTCLEADGLVIPGVGAFAACMAGLEAVAAPTLVRQRLAEGRPVLGICVGHQVMFSRGVEHGRSTTGLGVLPAVVEQLPTRPLPHLGWNQVEAPPDSSLFAGLGGERFYFVHSYAVRDASQLPAAAKVTWTNHDSVRFVAAVEYQGLSTTQFHPEKSGAAGAILLRNWVSNLGREA